MWSTGMFSDGIQTDMETQSLSSWSLSAACLHCRRAGALEACCLIGGKASPR